jgi:outer membrane lipoprotein carrier protein
LEAYRRTDSGRCSRRRLPRWTDLGLLALGIAGTTVAQPAADAEARLDSFLADIKSLTADFRQELWTADEQLQETDTGTLALARPNRFRWTYFEPTELLVVADGAQVFMYDVELAQVTIAPLDETVASSPAMLLSGDRSVRDGFDVVSTYERDGLDWVELAPKTGGTDFSSVLIGFDGATPQRLELVDGLNQITRISLSNVVVNPELADSVFEFEPPAGVDVIGERG